MLEVHKVSYRTASETILLTISSLVVCHMAITQHTNDARE